MMLLPAVVDGAIFLSSLALPATLHLRQRRRIRAAEAAARRPHGLSQRKAKTEPRWLSTLLDEAADLCSGDNTVLAITRIRRVIHQYLKGTRCEGDLATEFDVTVEHHLKDCLRSYLKAARRVTAAHAPVIEADLRESLDRLAGDMSALMERQSERDSEGVHRNRDFVRARHPASANDTP